MQLLKVIRNNSKAYSRKGRSQWKYSKELLKITEELVRNS